MRLTTVIGLGNTLMGDDGLGVVAVTRLSREWSVGSDVDVVDGGTAGMSLLPLIEGASRVILIDAIELGRDPGTLLVVPRERLPRYLATKISPHQIDLRDVLALAEIRGTLPDEAFAIGLQPAVIGMSTELSEPVARAMDGLVDEAVRRLRDFGHRCVRSRSPDERGVHPPVWSLLEETA